MQVLYCLPGTPLRSKAVRTVLEVGFKVERRADRGREIQHRSDQRRVIGRAAELVAGGLCTEAVAAGPVVVTPVVVGVPDQTRTIVVGNRPIARDDWDDELYMTASEKYRAIAVQIAECHMKGQPVLVGTVSIEKSEVLSQLLSDKKFWKEAGLDPSNLKS